MGSIDNTSFNTYVLRCIIQHKLTNISSFTFSFPSQKRKSIWNARDIILRQNLLLIRHRPPIVSCSSPHEICKSFIYMRMYLNLSMTFIKHSKRTWWCFCSLFPLEIENIILGRSVGISGCSSLNLCKTFVYVQYL